MSAGLSREAQRSIGKFEQEAKLKASLKDAHDRLSALMNIL